MSGELIGRVDTNNLFGGRPSGRKTDVLLVPTGKNYFKLIGDIATQIRASMDHTERNPSLLSPQAQHVEGKSKLNKIEKINILLLEGLSSQRTARAFATRLTLEEAANGFNNCFVGIDNVVYPADLAQRGRRGEMHFLGADVMSYMILGGGHGLGKLLHVARCKVSKGMLPDEAMREVHDQILKIYEVLHQRGGVGYADLILDHMRDALGLYRLKFQLK